LQDYKFFHPELKNQNLYPGGAGVRAQIVTSEGSLSIAIGRHIAELVKI